MPGIHHVIARTIKDLFCRYKTLQGFQVNRKAGWDTHGLPVELGVEKELGITKEDIGSKITVEEYNEACKKAVMRYTDVWNDLTKRVGYWVDMEDPYVTYKPKYMETVWWLLAEMYKKGLIYKGYELFGVEEAPNIREIFAQINLSSYLQDIGGTVRSLVSRTGIIILYLIFLLLEQRTFTAKMHGLVRDSDRLEEVLGLMEKIRSDIRSYIGIKVLTSAATALLSYAVLSFVGVDFASFWAVLIFFLNFIPTIGSIVATAFPSVLALVCKRLLRTLFQA